MTARWRLIAVALTLPIFAACGASAPRRAAVPARPTTTAAATVTTTAPTRTTTATTSTTTTVAPAAASTSSTSTTAACPPTLASQLAATGGGSQLITAEGTGGDHVVVTLWQQEGACWADAGGPWPGLAGAAGFSDHHVEGEETTPTGLYGIGDVMYGNAPNPGVAYPYHRLVCGDWWDEDPASPTYNTFQHVPCGQSPPFGGDSEALWTETAAYPSFAVIEYNTGPVVAGAGSAIFLHADTEGPTAGCVAIPPADLDQLLDALRPGDDPHIAMAPAGEITRF